MIWNQWYVFFTCNVEKAQFKKQLDILKLEFDDEKNEQMIMFQNTNGYFPQHSNTKIF